MHCSLPDPQGCEQPVHNMILLQIPDRKNGRDLPLRLVEEIVRERKAAEIFRLIRIRIPHELFQSSRQFRRQDAVKFCRNFPCTRMFPVCYFVHIFTDVLIKLLRDPVHPTGFKDRLHTVSDLPILTGCLHLPVPAYSPVICPDKGLEQAVRKEYFIKKLCLRSKIKTVIPFRIRPLRDLEESEIKALYGIIDPASSSYLSNTFLCRPGPPAVNDPDFFRVLIAGAGSF